MNDTIAATYTEQERRNLALVQTWAETWSSHELLPEFVARCYAPACEVFLPLQKSYWVRRGGTTQHFQDVESEGEKLYRQRELQIVRALPRGDTVAIEAKVLWTTFSGKTYESWIAAFLTFDADGKISTDHTYQPNIESKRELPPGLKAALDKIAAEH